MTGKTLIARQLAQLLDAREPKLISGPELLSMWVGRSEENIRCVLAGVGMWCRRYRRRIVCSIVASVCATY